MLSIQNEKGKQNNRNKQKFKFLCVFVYKACLIVVYKLTWQGALLFHRTKPANEEEVGSPWSEIPLNNPSRVLNANRILLFVRH